jgi:hypothetical protein
MRPRSCIQELCMADASITSCAAGLLQVWECRSRVARNLIARHCLLAFKIGLLRFLSLAWLCLLSLLGLALRDASLQRYESCSCAACREYGDDALPLGPSTPCVHEFCLCTFMGVLHWVYMHNHMCAIEIYYKSRYVNVPHRWVPCCFPSQAQTASPCAAATCTAAGRCPRRRMCAAITHAAGSNARACIPHSSKTAGRLQAAHSRAPTVAENQQQQWHCQQQQLQQQHEH